ncbi:CPBP family intramembrane metalloprotease [Clostridiaceae bacterium M8S5]|nr:CPBP family intramembrane metalloprotease [Clostridiaceae bacterium M8S5]
MNIRIQCLNIFILLLAINPISIGQLIRVSISRNQVNTDKINYIMLFVYVLITSLVALVSRELLSLRLPISNRWFVVAILLVPIVILVEILTVTIIHLIRGNVKIKLEFNGLGASAISSKISVVLIGVLEEIMYRQVWLAILIGVFNIHIALAIILSSLFYALNHISISRYVFIQKIIAGSIYSALYIASGTVLIPIITHGLQNAIIIARSK